MNRLARAKQRLNERVDAIGVPGDGGSLGTEEQVRAYISGTDADAHELLTTAHRNAEIQMVDAVANNVRPLSLLAGLWLQGFLTGIYYEREQEDE